MAVPSWKDVFRRKAKEAQEGRSFKWLEGENCFRVMPNKEDPGAAPAIHVGMHPEVGPNKAFLRCGVDEKGRGKCWLCNEKLTQLAKSQNPNNRKLAEKNARVVRLLLQASRVVDGKYGPPKPVWVSPGGPRSLYPPIMSVLYSTRKSCEDPAKGYNVTIERTGVQKNTVWGAPIFDDEPSKVPGSVLAQCKTLDELAGVYSAQAQQAAWMGKSLEDVEQEEQLEDVPEEEAGLDGEEAEEEVEEEEAGLDGEEAEEEVEEEEAAEEEVEEEEAGLDGEEAEEEEEAGLEEGVEEAEDLPFEEPEEPEPPKRRAVPPTKAPAKPAPKATGKPAGRPAPPPAGKRPAAPTGRPPARSTPPKGRR